jgi:hypothetical protein
VVAAQAAPRGYVVGNVNHEQPGGLPMPEVTVNVLIADDKMDKFAEVIHACRQAGLRIEQQMPLTGTVIGAIETDKLDNLKKVDGVSEVEVSRRISIPPSDSEIQ